MAIGRILGEWQLFEISGLDRVKQQLERAKFMSRDSLLIPKPNNNKSIFSASSRLQSKTTKYRQNH